MGKLPLWFHKNHLSQYLKILFSLLYNASLGNTGVLKRHLVYYLYQDQRMRWLDGITDSWTWVWVNSRSWWWTGRPGVLRFMGSQRVEDGWATELIPRSYPSYLSIPWHISKIFICAWSGNNDCQCLLSQEKDILIFFVSQRKKQKKHIMDIPS